MKKSKSKSLASTFLHLISILLIVVTFAFGALNFFKALGDTELASSSTLYDSLKISDDTYFVGGIMILLLLSISALLILITFILGLKRKKIHLLGILSAIVLIVTGVLIFTSLNIYINELASYTTDGNDGLLFDAAVTALKEILSLDYGAYLMGIAAILAGVSELSSAICCLIKK